MINFLQKVIENYYIDDVDFVIVHQERMTRIVDCPHFLMSKRDTIYERNKFLFPDFYIIDSWEDLINKIKKASINHHWESKEERVFWRGLTTGDLTSAPYSPRYNLASFDKLPRLSMVMLSKLYPNLIDAKFSYYIGDLDHPGHQEFKTILDSLNVISYEYVNEEEHLKYKYLASIDGNTSAWKRVPWIMASNSVLVKQETDTMQWFYPAIKPYTHYVPLKENLSDIFEQLEWMKNNDSKVKQISINAQNFVKNELMPKNIQAHAAITLNEYHKLHHKNKIIPSLPTAEEALAKAHKKAELENELRKSKFVQYRNKIRKTLKKFWKNIEILYNKL